MTVWPDGQCSISAIDNDYPLNGTFHKGITVIHKADFDEILSVPLSAAWPVVKKGSPDLGHVVYCITTFSEGRYKAMVSTGILPFAKNENSDVLDTKRNGAIPTYIGMTSKGMAERLKQHLYDTASGSMVRFHSVMRGDKYSPQLPAATIIRQLPTREECFAAEEKEIKEMALLEGTMSLNTLMGALDASNNLFEKFKSERNVDPERAEEVLSRLSSASTVNWQDPDYAEAVICNNDRNFDGHDVREIRLLSSLGASPEAIANKLNTSTIRVKSVISKKTYGRIL